MEERCISDPGCKPLLPQSHQHQPFQALSYCRALLLGLDLLTPWISAQKVRESHSPKEATAQVSHSRSTHNVGPQTLSTFLRTLQLTR